MNNDFIPLSELILNPDGSIYHLNLKAGEVATEIITVGDPDRVDEISRHFDHIELTRQHREFKTVTGTCKGKRLTVIATGIGTDNIDIVLNELDAVFQFDFTSRTRKKTSTKLRFIRIGTSGAVQEDIKLNTLLASDSALAFDRLLAFYDTQNFDQPDNWPERLSDVKPWITLATPRLTASVPNTFVHGVTATMPGFYAPQGRNFRLASLFGRNLEELRTLRIRGERVTNLEMETAGMYGLSALLGHEVISLNAILANRVTGEFSTNPKAAIAHLIEEALAWIITLPPPE
jgi:uridine phosphorylase